MTVRLPLILREAFEIETGAPRMLQWVMYISNIPKISVFENPRRRCSWSPCTER